MLGSKENFFVRASGFVVMKLSAFGASVAIFSIFWLLPNGKVSARALLPGALLTGLLWDLSKYVYILALPWLTFSRLWSVTLSVTLMFWAFLSGMLLLGAPYSALRVQRAALGRI